jgi:hypothetical protein
VIDPSALMTAKAATPSTGTYTKIYSTAYAFAALKADGSITAWGKPSDGGTAPSPNLANTLAAITVYAVIAFTSVGVPLMTQVVLSILKPVGSVGTTVQLAIVPPELLKADGSITAWGQNYGGTGATPSTGTYTKIYSTAYAFVE